MRRADENGDARAAIASSNLRRASRSNEKVGKAMRRRARRDVRRCAHARRRCRSTKNAGELDDGPSICARARIDAKEIEAKSARRIAAACRKLRASDLPPASARVKGGLSPQRKTIDKNTIYCVFDLIGLLFVVGMAWVRTMSESAHRCFSNGLARGNADAAEIASRARRHRSKNDLARRSRTECVVRCMSECCMNVATCGAKRDFSRVCPFVSREKMVQTVFK
jgi:hypothetical protein